MVSLLDNRFLNGLIHMHCTRATVVHLFKAQTDCFVSLYSPKNPVPDCRSSSSFSNNVILLLNFTSTFRDVVHARSHTEICQELDFDIINTGRLHSYRGENMLS